ncbi:MAG: ammonia-forming cytochrome c nitrite reductase subunit c552 [Deltaproteobacteria bacterium]|jgi:nitrite reductase (cytochrome c-552)|nr:ammonia-forming cytochrome c nitrite reductase subunit c552 [Deltaproteobacteria bacterium]
MRKHLIIAGLLVLSGIAVVMSGCSEAEEPLAPTYKTSIAKNETKASAFKSEFPNQYATYERNNESEIMTEYKGSIPFRKNDNVNPLPKGFKHSQPYLKNLWMGYPFMYEYNEARGHTYAVHDILAIDRINRYGEQAGLPATCWNCKTPKIPEWVAQYGDDKFWSLNFNDFRGKDKIDMKDESISCSYCHNPETMELQISSFPLAEALERQGKNWKEMSRNEMRSLVCGQCHVEYYFKEAKYGSNKKPVFPWDDGMDTEQMYEYYKRVGASTAEGFEGHFADWVHPVSNIPMLKAQHPEYETWSNGTHGAAGVACADCHMPYTRMEDGKKKTSNHQWTSPLKTPEGIDNACRQCHSDKTADYLRERVVYTQKKTFENLLSAQDMSVKAHEAVRLANEWDGAKHPQYKELMIQSKDLVRKGQFFWDMLSAENSIGFHNPSKALDTAQKSLEFSQQAIDLAMQATNYGIGPALAGDIKQIVPPILEWSREMQMDPAELAKHVWTRYLPLLPKTPQLWDLQDRLDQPAAPQAETAATPVASR